MDRYAGRVDVEPGGVVVQELELWLRLERALPDYADRKRWLAENARAFEL